MSNCILSDKTIVKNYALVPNTGTYLHFTGSMDTNGEVLSQTGTFDKAYLIKSVHVECNEKWYFNNECYANANVYVGLKAENGTWKEWQVGQTGNYGAAAHGTCYQDDGGDRYQDNLFRKTFNDWTTPSVAWRIRVVGGAFGQRGYWSTRGIITECEEV